MRSSPTAHPHARLCLFLAGLCTIAGLLSSTPPSLLAAESESPAISARDDDEIRSVVSTTWSILSDAKRPIEEREKALVLLAETSDDGLFDEEIAFVLSNLSRALPPAADEEWATDERILIHVLRGILTDENIPALFGCYSRLSELGRTAALFILADLETESGTRALVAILRTHGWPKTKHTPFLDLYTDELTQAEQILPPLFDGTVAGVPEDAVDNALLTFTIGDALPPTIAERALPSRIARASTLLEGLRAAQKEKSGLAWRFAPDYSTLRYEGGLCFDLLGRLGSSQAAVEVLQGASRLVDPRPAVFATCSLLRLGVEPSAEALARTAKDPETSWLLFDGCEETGKRALFPASERTQEKLAASDFVHWLCHPNELGRAPDHLELMEKIKSEPPEGEAGAVYHYVFRFKTDEPHWSAEQGWLAGVSGPYLEGAPPTPHPGGDTFSAFTAWEEKSAREHLEEVLGVLRSWRQERAEGVEDSEATGESGAGGG